MNEADIIGLVEKRQWVALASVMIFFLVRLTKEDNKFPIDIPPRWRPVVAFVLGMASGTLEAVMTGRGWIPALIGGGISASFAVFGHAMLVRGLANGKEIPIPGLMRKGLDKVEALEEAKAPLVERVKNIETEQVIELVRDAAKPDASKPS